MNVLISNVWQRQIDPKWLSAIACVKSSARLWNLHKPPATIENVQTPYQTVQVTVLIVTREMLILFTLLEVDMMIRFWSVLEMAR